MVVQVPADDVVDVSGVGNGFVAAAGSVLVVGRVLAAGVSGRASAGVAGRRAELVLVHMVAVHVVHVPVVQVVLVSVVLHALVAASCAVRVRMALVRLASAHAGSMALRRTHCKRARPSHCAGCFVGRCANWVTPDAG